MPAQKFPERLCKAVLNVKSTGFIGLFLLLVAFSANAGTALVDGWYLNLTNAAYAKIAPGAFSYVHNGEVNALLADVGPYNLDAGGTVVFSGTITNNFSTPLWNDIQFRWALLNSGGNEFAGTNDVGGSYTNYSGYWAGNPNNNPHPIYKLSDPSEVWWTINGVTNVGSGVLATGSAASSPPLGVYNFFILCHRISSASVQISATLSNDAGTYSYSVSATDDAPQTWTFDRVGLFFNAGKTTSGTLYFANLQIDYTNSPVLHPAGYTGNGFHFWWNGPTNEVFQVQASPMLPPAWVTLTNMVTSTNGIFDMIDSNPSSTNRFYRVFPAP